MIQHEQSCEMANKQTTGPGQKLILKGTFVIIKKNQVRYNSWSEVGWVFIQGWALFNFSYLFSWSWVPNQTNIIVYIILD